MRTRFTKAPQPYPSNPGPIRRADGSYVLYDQTTLLSTSRPWLAGHRGWVAYGPDGNYLGFRPRRWKHGGYSWIIVPRKFKTAEHALKALERAFPLSPSNRS